MEADFQKPKVLIIQPVMAHYRRSLFESLLSRPEFNVEFLSGSDYLGIKEIENIDYIKGKYFSIRFLRHTFYYLRGTLRHIRKSKPDFIISGGIDPHQFHILAAFILFRLFLGKKFIWWSHASSGSQGYIGELFRKFFYRKATGIMTYNKLGRELLESWGVAPSKLISIGNCLNTEDYGYLNYDLEDKQNNTNEFNIVFSGRINNERRLDILIKAIAEINITSLKCYIIGNGDTNDLETLSKNLGISDKIIFTGPLYGQDISKIFLKANLMVYPKAIGLSLLHAHSFGLPVITTDNISIQMPEIELLAPGVTGDVYKDENVSNLVQKIIRWHKKINNSNEQIHKACIKQIQEMRYLPEYMAESMVKFIINSNKA